MKIRVTSGTGEGKTKINAFDRALLDAGIGDYNLIKLSSVIPESSEVEVGRPELKEADYGDKLYIVLSESREDREGYEAWAGLGWTQEESGKGIFMEASRDSKEEVEETIKLEIEDAKTYRDEDLKTSEVEIVGKECREGPVCSVVAAVYEDEDWG